MINLNNTPSAGKLTARDFEHKRRHLGLDQQGRFPDAMPTPSDEASQIGWGAFIPAFLALILVAAAAGIAHLLAMVFA